jgi:hypothetical protein
LDTTVVPAKSLSPEVAQSLGKRITGYTLRNAYPISVSSEISLCLAAATTGPQAGQDGDGVEVAACKHGALSQVWIPVQYEASGPTYTWDEASGATYTWLVNAEYPSMCLNADESGGVHQATRVDLWKCYWPLGGDSGGFNDLWDFGTWLHAMKSGATSYPLFLGGSNLSMDADDNSLADGLLIAPVSVIDHYTVSWEYWY